MYQHNNRQSSQGDVSTPLSFNSTDTFMLFDKCVSGAHLDAHKIPIETLSPSKSTPVSTNVSLTEQLVEIDSLDAAENNRMSKRRLSLNKAERRAEHNATERVRRECLNYKFQRLAEVLPNLQSHRRPSKGQIVEKALDWVKQNISKEDTYQYQIMQLRNENKRLLSQINVCKEAPTDGIFSPPPTETLNFSLDLPPSPNINSSFKASEDITLIETHSNVSSKITSQQAVYYHPIEDMSLLYHMYPYNLAWVRREDFDVGEPNLVYVAPSTSTSRNETFSTEDDNDSNSNSSSDGTQTSYRPVPTMFDANVSLATASPWNEIDHHSPYLLHPLMNSTDQLHTS